MKILLVEDDTALRGALEELLCREGYDVIKASNVSSARSAMNSEVDLVMLDVGLPDGDGVSQPAVSKWDTGSKLPSVEILCKLADLYCVSTDYLLGREELKQTVEINDDIISLETLQCMNGKPVWDNARGWGIVNSVLDYVIFLDGSKIILAEAMNLRAMAPAYSMGYSPSTKPISHEDLGKYKSIWVKPITPDSFLQEELTGWYEVNNFYVQNQFGTRFLFDTYGTRWLAFEMEF